MKVGDWVEVRSKEEILKTLDSNGQLDGMPFMPEMFAFCGQRFRVYKRAHKTCDTVFPVRGRRVDRAVHLETRCDGQAHGGCQAGCLIFWKEAWLKPVDGAGASAQDPLISITGTTEASVWAQAQMTGANGGAPRYVCQATQLPYATTSLNWWDLRQYGEDYTFGKCRPLADPLWSCVFDVLQPQPGRDRSRARHAVVLQQVPLALGWNKISQEYRHYSRRTADPDSDPQSTTWRTRPREIT